MNTRNAMGFPANPSVGDFYEGWEWDGEKWVAVDSEEHANISKGDTEGQIATWNDPDQIWKPNDAVVVKDGNVGIGAGLPGAKLTVTTADNGEQAYFGSLSNDRGLVISTFLSNATGVGVDLNARGVTGVNGVLTFSTNNTERLTIDSNGDATFGGTVVLTGGSSQASSAHPHLYRSAGNLHISGRSDGGAGGNIFIQTGASSSTAMTIDANGNVGIGTSSPGRRLSIEGEGSDCRVEVKNKNTNARISVSSPDSGSPQISFDNGLLLTQYGSARLTIDNSGDATFSGNVSAGSFFKTTEAGQPATYIRSNYGGRSAYQTDDTEARIVVSNSVLSAVFNSSGIMSSRFIQDGAPVVDSLQIIRAFMKLRDAVDDPDSTVEQLRDKLKVAVVDIIDQFQELVDSVEPEVSTMPAPEDS